MSNPKTRRVAFKLPSPALPTTQVTVSIDVHIRRSMSWAHLSNFNDYDFVQSEERKKLKKSLCKSLQDLSAKERKADFASERIGSQERWQTLMMEHAVFQFLKRANYGNMDGKFLHSDVLQTSGDFFSIYSFICHMPKVPKLSAKVPIWDGSLVGSEMVKLRQKMMDCAIRMLRHLSTIRPLRKSDLLNPVALCARPRVIGFLYSLIVRILEKNGYE